MALWESAIEHIKAVYERHPGSGGCLHIVVDDDNYDTSCVEFCLEQAKTNQCGPCIAAANSLLELKECDRFLAINRYHFPNSTQTWEEFQAEPWIG